MFITSHQFEELVRRVNRDEEVLECVLEDISNLQGTSSIANISGSISPSNRAESVLTMSLSTTDTDTNALAVVDTKGAPAVLDPGSVTWTVDNSGAVANLTPSADGSTATFTIGVAGDATITATVADQASADVPAFTVPFAVTVVGGEPVSGTITVTADPAPAPVEEPPATPAPAPAPVEEPPSTVVPAPATGTADPTAAG